MEFPDTAKLLMLIKANWMRQTSDDATIAIWTQILGADLTLSETWAATLELIRLGRPEPPTAGEVYNFTLSERARLAERARSSRKLLDEPARTPEEIEQARKWFSDITATIGHWGNVHS